MNALCGRVLRIAAATALVGSSAATMASPPTTFVGLAPIGPAEMARLSGGLDVGSLKVDVTARVRTYINDRLAVAEEYRITRLNEARQRIQTRLSQVNQLNQPVDNRVTEAVDASIDHAASENSGPESIARIPRTVRTVRSDGGLRSRTIDEGDGGATTMTFDFGRDQLVSTIANTANDRHVYQQVNVEVQVANFREFTSNIRSSLLAERIGRAVNGH